METFLALLGGVLIGQVGTVITHVLATRRDRQQAALAEKAAANQWAREEKSKETQREHELHIPSHAAHAGS